MDPNAVPRPAHLDNLESHFKIRDPVPKSTFSSSLIMKSASSLKKNIKLA